MEQWISAIPAALFTLGLLACTLDLSITAIRSPFFAANVRMPQLTTWIPVGLHFVPLALYAASFIVFTSTVDGYEPDVFDFYAGNKWTALVIIAITLLGQLVLIVYANHMRRTHANEREAQRSH